MKVLNGRHDDLKSLLLARIEWLEQQADESELAARQADERASSCLSDAALFLARARECRDAISNLYGDT